MYNLKNYGSMIADDTRMKAYVEALRVAVKPGDVVADIGTGAGLFALLACKFGASRVYAIEPNENIMVAKKLAAQNGFLDRIEFIQDFSTKVNLDEKVDVIVSDLRGTLPLFEKHLPALIDARKRFLKPEGILLPKQDTLSVCVVEAPELYKKYSGVWDENPYSLNLNIARNMAVNTFYPARVGAEQMLTDSQTWACLDYHNLNLFDARGKISQKFVRNGIAHGIMVWFDAELIDGIGFSNSPGSREYTRVYGSAFFPLFRPVAVLNGDQANVEISAKIINGDYIWNWNTDIVSDNNLSRANFRQSTFYGTLFSLSHINKRKSEYVPQLNSEGLMENFIQQEMNGVNSIEIIAGKLFSRFPEQFTSLQEAIDRVGDTSEKFSGL